MIRWPTVSLAKERAISSRSDTRALRKGLLLAAVALLVVTAVFVGTSLVEAGQLRTLELKGPADISTVEGFSGGTEDLVFRANGREVFASAPNFHDATKPGGIFLVDVDERTVTNVTPPEWLAPGKLQPHGVDLWHGDEGERLFVVNHPGGSAMPEAAGQSGHDAVHAVEIFDVAADGRLRHVRTVSDELFLSPNDVAAVSAESFYVSNDHGYAGGVLRMLEDFGRLSAGNVVFVDASGGARIVWEGTRYANGIQTSADGSSVYLAETTRGTVTWLARDPTSNELTFVSRHDTGTGVDNIDVAADGSLWIGAHPKLLAFLAHSKDPANERSPSEVLRLVPSRDRWQQSIVYLGDGDPLSGSSVAASNGEVVVVGAVFDPRLLVWKTR